MTLEQQACEEHFVKHTIQKTYGRFMVRLPTKMEPNHIGTSRLSANEDHMQVNTGWKEIQNSTSIITLS